MKKLVLILVPITVLGLLTVVLAHSANVEVSKVTTGSGNTFTWDVSGLAAAPAGDVTAGCAAFPIAIPFGSRSVTPPGMGVNPYPNANEFDYPPLPPSYESFVNHADNVPLAQAEEGSVYKVTNGPDVGNFAWLVWNVGINPTAQTLANSLTWPGDSTDYSDHGDGGTILPGFSHVVRGYVEPDDPTDTTLHIGDWVASNTGSANAVAVREALNKHIDLGRTLRLLVWEESLDSGSRRQYRVAGFALFRIHGYRLSQGDDGPWLLFEFIRWDTSCGQPTKALESVAISGSNTGLVNIPYTFLAEVTPLDATQPISYTWESTGDPPMVVHTGGLSDMAVFTWMGEGTHSVTVTAENAAGISVVNTHAIEIEGSRQIYFPIALRK